ncbi:inositol polyphosphate 1-phosphatase isoform X2 [Myotis daubentonii]|uniref:inositol polyphosphate 1-phosphatase isoform X2 n=1 Tax=Myotis daubentonii TaxID=98922 RepID=UPI002873ECB0|nr:inositol polyphosphate 1-phosphatase isoform X2 [Myotis daubentonii]
MSAILQELLRVSEKAAHIARACRQQDALFQLLIEEKKDGEKNKKFAVDFKTLADVLVQEVIKRHMESKFPGLEDKIFGEESNEFTNALDSTHQYIQGSADVEPSHGIFPQGLPCVTILIGVYDLRTGLPLMGVINQPFVSQDPDTLRWEGRCYWGLSYMGTNIHSLQPPVSEPQGARTGHPGAEAADTGSQAQGAHRFSAVISASEQEPVRAALARVCGGRVFRAAGAGYKGLCVVQGLVDLYVFSYDTTFKWDSCAPHAILRAMGGGMVDFQGCLARGPAAGREWPQLLYHVGHEGASGVDRWANRGGLIAYRSRQQLETFLSLLAPHLAPAGARA